jgi:hypothetical protein
MKNVLLILLLPLNMVFCQQIFINEVCTSNDTVVLDSNYNYSDWIEIYNATNNDFDIGGYFLSDNDNKPEKWQFPANLIVPANGFLLVWASEDNMMVNGVEPHTNFKLESDGENLLLSAPDTSLVEQLTIPAIGTDKSFGRQPDGSNAWYTFDTPSPGSSNNTTIATLLEPVFSNPAGFYSDSFTLYLSSPNSGDTILYTVDGSEPNIDHVGGKYYTTKQDYSSTDTINLSYRTFIYTAAGIPIKNNQSDTNKLSMIRPSPNWWTAPQTNVNKNRVVRAVAYQTGSKCSKIQTNSFFVDPSAENRYSLPVVSISTNEDNLFDYYRGIHVPGKFYYDYAPLGGYWPKITANYNRKGREWERPAMIEYFDNQGIRAVAQNVGIRIAGNVSRGWSRKSFRIYARSEYDTQNKFEYPFFDGLKQMGNTQKDLTEFKRLTLRNSGTYWSEQLFQDAFCQHTFKHIGVDVLHFSPTVVFVNGTYWGVMNFRQRIDNRYLKSHYGIKEEDAVILKGNSGNISTGLGVDSINYIAMRNYIHNEDMSVQVHYDSACRLLDPENFAKLFMTQIYVNNSDWLSNNRKCWKKRTTSYQPNASYGQDGRYRWFVFDLDHGFKHAEEDRLDIVMSGSGADTRIFRSLMENTEFKRYWINLMADNMNTSFKTARVLDIIDSLNLIYDPEIPEHKARWWYMWDNNSTDNMEGFALQRPFYMRQFILDQFTELTDTNEVTLNVQNNIGGKIKINTTVIDMHTVGNTSNAYPWIGTYFKGIPVQLVAIPDDGYRFIEWQGTGITTDSLDLAFVGDTTVTAVFGIADTINSLFINELLSKNDDIVLDNNDQFEDFIELYNAGNTEIKIAGLYLSDNPNNKLKWRIPEEIGNLGAGEFALFWADEDQSQGFNHTNFKLGDNETVFLYQLIGTDTILIDQLSTDANGYKNISKGRYANGTSTIQLFEFPSPGKSNELAPTFSGIYINEFMCDNLNAVVDEFGENDDWIELYNSTTNPVNVAGLVLTDDYLELTKHRIPITDSDSMTIAAGGYLLLWADKDQEQGIRHLGFKLNNVAEQIALSKYSELDSAVIDSISYYAFAPNTSYGRQPDGSSTWSGMDFTPNASNVTSIVYNQSEDFYCTIYPNPSSGTFTVEGTDLEEIHIIDINGRRVLSQSLGHSRNTILLDGYSNGIYILEIKHKKGLAYGKLVLKR